MRDVAIGIGIAGVVVAALVAGFTWLFAQNEAAQQELAALRQQLEQQSAKPEPGRVDTGRTDPQVAARLDRLESALKEISERLEARQEPARVDDTTQAAALTQRAASQPAKFSDPYVAPSNPAPDPSSQQPITERGFATISRRIAAEGAAPEQAQSVSQALEQLTFSNPELTTGLSFDQPQCSEARCAVKADVSQTKFSEAALRNDPDFQAEDAYYDFIKETQDQIDSAMSRKTQVSIYRHGDDMVMRIVPKQSRQGEGEDSAAK